MTATITFADGTSLTAEALNGYFMMNEEPVFPENRSWVTVTVGGVTTRYVHFTVTEYQGGDGEYLFSFDEPSKEATEVLVLQAQNDMLIECILEMSEIIYGE